MPTVLNCLLNFSYSVRKHTSLRALQRITSERRKSFAVGSCNLVELKMSMRERRQGSNSCSHVITKAPSNTISPAPSSRPCSISTRINQKRFRQSSVLAKPTWRKRSTIKPRKFLPTSRKILSLPWRSAPISYSASSHSAKMITMELVASFYPFSKILQTQN